MLVLLVSVSLKVTQINLQCVQVLHVSLRPSCSQLCQHSWPPESCCNRSWTSNTKNLLATTTCRQAACVSCCSALLSGVFWNSFKTAGGLYPSSLEWYLMDYFQPKIKWNSHKRPFRVLSINRWQNLVSMLWGYQTGIQGEGGGGSPRRVLSYWMENFQETI